MLKWITTWTNWLIENNDTFSSDLWTVKSERDNNKDSVKWILSWENERKELLDLCNENPTFTRVYLARHLPVEKDENYFVDQKLREDWVKWWKRTEINNKLKVIDYIPINSALYKLLKTFYSWTIHCDTQWILNNRTKDSFPIFIKECANDWVTVEHCELVWWSKENDKWANVINAWKDIMDFLQEIDTKGQDVLII